MGVVGRGRRTDSDRVRSGDEVELLLNRKMRFGGRATRCCWRSWCTARHRWRRLTPELPREHHTLRDDCPEKEHAALPGRHAARRTARASSGGRANRRPGFGPDAGAARRSWFRLASQTEAWRGRSSSGRRFSSASRTVRGTVARRDAAGRWCYGGASCTRLTFCQATVMGLLAAGDLGRLMNR